MHIAGLQKLTLLDYPGKVAATVFLAACNFRCPFCHNARLVENPKEEKESRRKKFSVFSKTQRYLGRVAVTGGETLIWSRQPSS